jgi:hypothetical protein
MTDKRRSLGLTANHAPATAGTKQMNIPSDEA